MTTTRHVFRVHPMTYLYGCAYGTLIALAALVAAATWYFLGETAMARFVLALPLLYGALGIVVSEMRDTETRRLPGVPMTRRGREELRTWQWQTAIRSAEGKIVNSHDGAGPVMPTPEQWAAYQAELVANRATTIV